MLCFERGAGSEALSKLNLIIKQLYKIRKLDLLAEGETLNEENLAKAKILHILVTKNCCFTFFASVISFEAISYVSLHNCTTDHKSQVSFFRTKSCESAQSTKVTLQ